MTANRTLIFALVALLLVTGNLNQSLWWMSPSLVAEHGLGWMVVAVAVAVLVLAGLLFQAERLLLFVYNPYAIHESTNIFPQIRSVWINLFLFSSFAGGVLLCSHHILVAAWQSNIQFSLYTEQGIFPSFSLLLASQYQLIGGFDEQLPWLLYQLGGLVLVSLLLAMRMVVVWLLVVALVAVVVAFGVLFTVELPLPSLMEDLPVSDYHFGDGFVLVLETSLAGFGLVFGLARWRGLAAQPGWLLYALVLLAAVYALHIIAAWQFSRYTWVSETAVSDRLLFHLPYAFYQSQSGWLHWLWFVLVSFLAWLKTGLILNFGAVVISHMVRVSIISTQLMLIALIGFLAVCWLAIGEFGEAGESNSLALLFDLLFHGALFWWYPVHVLLLCALAFAVPSDDHAAFVWREHPLLAWALRISYLPLMGFLCWYLFDAVNIRLLQPGSGG